MGSRTCFFVGLGSVQCRSCSATMLKPICWSLMLAWENMMLRVHQVKVNLSSFLAFLFDSCHTSTTLLQQALRYEHDASSSDDSDGESTSSEGAERGYVDLTLQRLQTMRAVASEVDTTANKISSHGKSRARIERVLRWPICECACRLPFGTLLRLCMAFWLLSKRAQDTVLWEIQREHPGGGKRDWYLEGRFPTKCLCKK